jgi:hypothetical protein
MPLGGRKNKGKKPAPMMQLDTAEDPLAQSYAVRGGARGEEVVLGMGAGSKSKGDEVTINSEGITFRGDTKRLNEQDLEEFYPGGDNFLGRGAAGMVELMRIRATGDAVAVKHIAVDDKNDRDQTIQEVESMWRLNHPNIGAPLAGTLRFARAVLTRESLPCAGWQCCSTARTSVRPTTRSASCLSL